MVKRILITGASGFVGHHFVEEVLKNTDWEIIALVRGKTVGDLHRLIDSKIGHTSNGDRVSIVACDLRFPINATVDSRIGHIDYVCHLAANSHVDRSITHPVEFFEDNVMGTVNLLEWARLRNSGFTSLDNVVPPFGKIEKFLNFNTDEVFGPAPHGIDWKETDRFRPSNPYSGSKMGQWGAGYSYWITYKLPVISTHMMNIFGERQNSEKLVPKTIKKILAGEPMTIHCKIEGGSQETDDPSIVSEIGERHWLHARNAANATLFILQNGVAGDIFNIVGDDELTNLELVEKIHGIIQDAHKEVCVVCASGHSEDCKDAVPSLKIKYQDFHSARPGHDRRYALDGTKLKQLGWTPPVDFDTSLKKTVEWYLLPENKQWLQ
jgi:dTDP-glucose 4,6-dehydratase